MVQPVIVAGASRAAIDCTLLRSPCPISSEIYSGHIHRPAL
jgi:hypothetical protein